MPEDFGPKLALAVALCPGARVIGIPATVTLKPDPVALTVLTVMLELPLGDEFESVIDWLLFEPTTTLPKSSEEAFTPRLPEVCGLGLAFAPKPQDKVPRANERAAMSPNRRALKLDRVTIYLFWACRVCRDYG